MNKTSLREYSKIKFQKLLSKRNINYKYIYKDIYT